MRLLYPSTVNSYNGEMVSVYWKRSLMLTLYYTWISNYNIHYNACDETTYPYQTSMAPLKFLNGWLISSHTLLSIWLRIHAVIKVNQDTDVSRQTYWSENKIMACHLFSTKPLSESVWDYYTLDPWEQLSVKFETKYNNSHAPPKWISKCCLQNRGHFVLASILLLIWCANECNHTWHLTEHSPGIYIFISIVSIQYLLSNL